jgi:integrase
MATIQERKDRFGKPRYLVTIRIKGHPTQCETFRRKTDAKRWAEKTESAIREGRYFDVAEAKRHTFAELVDRYVKEVMPRKSPIQQRLQTTQLEWWKQELGSYTLADLSKARIVEARDKLAGIEVRGGKERSPASVNRHLAVLSHCLNTAVDPWEWMKQPPSFKNIRLSEPRGRVRFLSDDERKRLLEACKASSEPFLYTLVVLALSTGARQGELLSLVWSQVDFKAEVIRLDKTKNDERRALPLAGHALELMRDLAKVRRIDSDLVFPHSDGKRPFCPRSSWEKALKEAKVEDFRFHDLRHSAASYLAMNGATLPEIAAVLGHKTLQMVQRYAHISEQHTSKVVAAMNASIFDQTLDSTGG